MCLGFSLIRSEKPFRRERKKSGCAWGGVDVRMKRGGIVRILISWKDGARCGCGAQPCALQNLLVPGPHLPQTSASPGTAQVREKSALPSLVTPRPLPRSCQAPSPGPAPT